MEHNDERQIAEFERRLRLAMRHREAPLGLKQRVLARARERRQAELGLRGNRWWMLQRIAASAVLAAVFGGFAVYHHVEQQRKGEEAREKVMTAFRITSKTLNRVNERLEDDNR